MSDNSITLNTKKHHMHYTALLLPANEQKMESRHYLCPEFMEPRVGSVVSQRQTFEITLELWHMAGNGLYHHHAQCLAPAQIDIYDEKKLCVCVYLPSCIIQGSSRAHSVLSPHLCVCVCVCVMEKEQH